MCGHVWRSNKKISVCVKCGLTISKATGRPLLFDKTLVNYVNNDYKKPRRKRKKEEQKNA